MSKFTNWLKKQQFYTKKHKNKSEAIISTKIEPSPGYRMPLCGMIRVRNGQKYINYPLEQMQRMPYLGKIIVFNDHSTDNTVKICKRYSKVEIFNSPFNRNDYNEWRDRNYIMNLAKKYCPEWILTFDADEVFEDRIYEIMPGLLKPSSPQILYYTFPLFHHWNTPNLYNTHGLWGSFIQGRMFKNLPNQEIPRVDETNLSGSTPWFDNFNTRLVLCRIRHFGNMDPEDRKRKYDHYAKLYRDKGPSKLALGAWEPFYKKLYKKDKLDPEDYIRHLIDPVCEKLYKWKDRVSISLNVITKNNETEISRLINCVSSIIDEVVVVDTGSIDGTVNILKSMKDVKLIQTEWKHDFSYARNLCLKNSSGNMILRLDPDELIDSNDILKIWHLANIDDFDGFVFPVKNYLENPAENPNAKWFYSQTIRLFKNLPQIKFSGLVHEEIMKSLSSQNLGRRGQVGFSNVLVHHFGYLADKGYLEKKFDYYYKLCLKQLELTPDDFYMYHSIAVHMKHIGKDDEAIKYYKKSIELNPMAFLSYVGLGEIEMDRKNYEKAEEYFMQALKIKSELKTDQADYMIKQNLIKAKIQKEMDLLEKAEKETDKTNIERSFK